MAALEKEEQATRSELDQLNRSAQTRVWLESELADLEAALQSAFDQGDYNLILELTAKAKRLQEEVDKVNAATGQGGGNRPCIDSLESEVQKLQAEMQAKAREGDFVNAMKAGARVSEGREGGGRGALWRCSPSALHPRRRRRAPRSQSSRRWTRRSRRCRPWRCSARSA